MTNSWCRVSRCYAVALLAAASLLAAALPAEPIRLRIAAANLTSGGNQSYDPGHGIRILKALEPDVILIQEFCYDKAPVRELLDQIAGKDFHFYQEADGQLPNGVISRYPIRQAGCWKDTQAGNRDFAYAVIDLPGEKDLWAVSVPLLAGGDDVERRNDQAEALVKYVKSKVPAGQFLTIGGDFNTQKRGEICVDTLGAVIANAGPYPEDQAGNVGTNANRNKPYDWVLANPALQALAVPTRFGATTLPGGLVFDSRVFKPLESAAPVERGDSAALNMQHMAVIRDFQLP